MRTLLLMAVGVVAVSLSGPLMAAMVVPPLAISFWRNGLATAALAPGVAGGRRAEVAGVRGRTLGLVLGSGSSARRALRDVGDLPDADLGGVRDGDRLPAGGLGGGLAAAPRRAVQRRRGVRAGDGVRRGARRLGCGPDASRRGRWSVTCSPSSEGLRAAAYMLIGSRARQALSTTTYTFVCYGTCALVLLVACVVSGQRLWGYPLTQWGLLVLVTATAQLMGHSVFNHLLATTAPMLVSLVLLLEVPGAALLAAVILGQVPPLGAVVGLLVILAGMALVVLSNGAPGIERRPSTETKATATEVPAGRTTAVRSLILSPREEVPHVDELASCAPAVPATPSPAPTRASSRRRRALDADQVFLDLEDSVAPLAKADARKNIVEALNAGDWGTKVRTVRVNDWTTQWTYRDVIEVVEGAGANLDCIMLPKVQTAEQVVALDLLLTQIEKTMGSRSAGSASRRRSRTRSA